MLEVTIELDLVTYILRNGNPVTARHRGTQFTAEDGKPVMFPGEYHTHDGTHVAAIEAS